MIKKFNDFSSPTCRVCDSTMYVTDDAGRCKIYHCKSNEARFWDFDRGSKEQNTAKKHWDDSALEICR